MTVELITTLAIGAILVLILLEVPVAFALMIGGVLGILLMGQFGIAFSTLAAAPYGAIGKYDLLVLPMFILLGAFVGNAGIATAIFTAANRLLGWLPGGLAVATIFACTVFGGISGSSAADVATIGRISVNEMRKHGYSASFAAGVVAAAGTVDILIPPSIPIVIYGILTGLPIGSLLLAGILPGLFTSLVFATYIVLRAKWLQRSAKSSPSPHGQSTSVAAHAGNGIDQHPYVGLAYAGLLFLIIAGGMYSGLFTATEAAAVGAFTSALIAFRLSRSQGRWGFFKIMKTSLLETATVSSSIFALLMGTAVFTYFLALTRIPLELTSWIVSLDVSPKVVVAAFLLLLFPLGMFIDGLSMMLLTVPIAYPILSNLGVDGIWLGILVITMIEVGLITPPVGINVYVIVGLIDDLTLQEAFAGAAPFVVLQLMITAILFAFPDIILFLPRLAAGG